MEDPLTEIARDGARRLLAAALRAEAFVAQDAQETLPDGRQRVVRHGYAPERSIRTGIGALEVRRPKVRERAAEVPGEKRSRVNSAMLPRWARRSKRLDALLPVLYLWGISTGAFQKALSALLGTDAPNLSPGEISRLTREWQTEYDRWQRRDLSAEACVYARADGVSSGRGWSRGRPGGIGERRRPHRQRPLGRSAARRPRGIHGAPLGRGPAVERPLRAPGRPLCHLGLTRDGHPRHPL